MLVSCTGAIVLLRLRAAVIASSGHSSGTLHNHGRVTDVWDVGALPLLVVAGLLPAVVELDDLFSGLRHDLQSLEIPYGSRTSM